MSEDHRKIADCHHLDVKRVPSTTRTEITFYGRNSAGNRVRFTVNFPWYFWPYLVRAMFKAWQEERKSRVAEIAEINEIFNERQAS